MTDLFTYTEYRKFLADAWTERKAQDPRFSHRFIAQRAGFNSSAFFSRILTGDVNLSPSGALRLAEVFHLNHQETRYFELLVLFDQARSQEERLHFLDRIATWRKSPVPEIDSSQIAFCRDWKAVAVLETLDLIEHRDDHEAMGKMMRPRIPGAEVEENLRLLAAGQASRPDLFGTCSSPWTVPLPTPCTVVLEISLDSIRISDSLPALGGIDTVWTTQTFKTSTPYSYTSCGSSLWTDSNSLQVHCTHMIGVLLSSDSTWSDSTARYPVTQTSQIDTIWRDTTSYSPADSSTCSRADTSTVTCYRLESVQRTDSSAVVPGTKRDSL
jgi:hypothetical protein